MLRLYPCNVCTSVIPPPGTSAVEGGGVTIEIAEQCVHSLISGVLETNALP
jgi:hypothetical protein